MLRQEDLYPLYKKFQDYTGQSAHFEYPLGLQTVAVKALDGKLLFTFNSLWDFYWELARFVKTDESHANMYEKAVAYQEGLPE